MRARDQSSDGKFRPDYGLLLELHALTLVAHSYALLSSLKAYLQYSTPVYIGLTYSGNRLLQILIHLERGQKVCWQQ